MTDYWPGTDPDALAASMSRDRNDARALAYVVAGILVWALTLAVGMEFGRTQQRLETPTFCEGTASPIRVVPRYVPRGKP